MSHPRFPDGDEQGLNMTPMIDIVFQLLVFFLLTLKFKSVDRRIDSALPKGPGLRPIHQFVDLPPRTVVKLFREDLDTPDAAFTRVRIGNHTTYDLPPPAAEDRREAVLAEMAETIRLAQLARGGDAHGEIRTPLPKGLCVPHGDVMAVLDAFLAAEVRNITFQGAMSPHMPGQ